jgi:hypothetical protein
VSGVAQQKDMAMRLLAIDLAKRSFHVHGVDADGGVISRRVGRSRLTALVDQLDPAVIAMGAGWCAPPLTTGGGPSWRPDGAFG